MTANDPALDALLAAVEASPEFVPLRLRVVEMLIERDRYSDAVAHCVKALAVEPSNLDVHAALARASAELSGTEQVSFDWNAAESQVADIVVHTMDNDYAKAPVTLADVAGMEAVKRQIELSFLAPIRHPELARAYGNPPGGGLLLYGPPGCGKTFIASAVAGEIGADFHHVGITDVLDMYIGASEKNLADIFATARRSAPCVLFFDEIDALGQKRSQIGHSSSMRQTVNQLLTEMDSAANRNDGVFVLGATNHPWDVDSALRRPGRFDRLQLVTPPDAEARAAIVRACMAGKPATAIDFDAVVRSTQGFSGADLTHLCRTAAQMAMSDAISSGELRAITDNDIRAARASMVSSTSEWFETARNVVEFANRDGAFDELATYLKRRNKRSM